MPTPIRVNIA
ncbi:hypothetical protein AARAC_011841, partial [Aspergillus arachidicola]